MSALHNLVITPRAADLPPGIDPSSVLTAVGTDHVYAQIRDEQNLVTVTDHARTLGIDVTIVVVPNNPERQADLRDLATAVGKHQHGTVLVLSPDAAGTYSDTFSRVRLEGAEDVAKTHHGRPVESAMGFVDKLAGGTTVPWTAISGVVLAGTVLVAGGLYLVKSRRAAANPVSHAPSANPVSQGPSADLISRTPSADSPDARPTV